LDKLGDPSSVVAMPAPPPGFFAPGTYPTSIDDAGDVVSSTNSQGAVTFSYRGPCGVGAIAFLVDSAVKAPLLFDRTVGTVAGWDIPQ